MLSFCCCRGARICHESYNQSHIPTGCSRVEKERKPLFWCEYRSNGDMSCLLQCGRQASRCTILQRNQTTSSQRGEQWERFVERICMEVDVVEHHRKNQIVWFRNLHDICCHPFHISRIHHRGCALWGPERLVPDRTHRWIQCVWSCRQDSACSLSPWECKRRGCCLCREVTVLSSIPGLLARSRVLPERNSCHGIDMSPWVDKWVFYVCVDDSCSQSCANTAFWDCRDCDSYVLGSWLGCWFSSYLVLGRLIEQIELVWLNCKGKLSIWMNLCSLCIGLWSLNPKVWSLCIKLRICWYISLSTIRPALLYDIKYWVIKRYHAQKMSVIDIHILCWMCGNTRRDKVRMRIFILK